LNIVSGEIHPDSGSALVACEPSLIVPQISSGG